MITRRSLRFFSSLALAAVFVKGSAVAESAAATAKRVTYYCQTQLGQRF